MANNQVKKVKPYPFKGELKESTTTRPCQIVLLTQAAVLLEAVGGSVQPGDKVEVSFQTPVLGQPVQFQGLVVKVYNQLAGASAPHGDAATGTIHRLEIHIRSIDPLHMNHIARFLDQIGQKSRP
ncbi:MAG: PilZ domain-containing protein [Bdellovibrionales bacterium]|jgi:hypothetical protein|nr:PilZ domain-containing protein [Bdellovibrionales bacterium]